VRQLRKLKNLSGYQLKARDGEIGKLKQIYFDDRRWVIRYLVVKTGSWLLGQDVLIIPSMIDSVVEEDQQIAVNLSSDQVRQSPPINTELPVSRHYEQEYFRYYGWQPYWSADPMFVPTPIITPLGEGELPKQPEHPHLRSSDEVKGYHLHSQDGKIGHVEDFILDGQDWNIRFLEIDTGHWLPGKKVLLSPSWLREVDFTLNEITVDLPSERIKTAPEYDPDKIISRDYQLALYKHYRKAIEEE